MWEITNLIELFEEVKKRIGENVVHTDFSKAFDKDLYSRQTQKVRSLELNSKLAWL